MSPYSWISAKAVSLDSGYEVTVYARNTGAIEDDFHAHFFEDKLAALINPVCSDKEGLARCEIEVDGLPSARKWNKNDSLDDYMEAGEYKIDVIAFAEPGILDADLANGISELARDLSETGHAAQLSVVEGDDTLIFTENLSSPEDAELLTPHAIIEKMNEWRATSETCENYEQWLAQRRHPVGQ